MAGEAKEKCAVTAVIGFDAEMPASSYAYECLFAMQHRGTEASGMAAQKADKSIETRRSLGMVRDVYNEKILSRLAGSIAIGHNRYSTSGSKLRHPAPYKDTAIDFAFAHNGNLPTTTKLEQHLSKHNINTRRFNDSEMMGLSIAQHIRSGKSMAEAIELSYPLFQGAFSCVAMHDGAVAAFRDEKGIRPLAIGVCEDGYIVSSETCGLDIVGASYEREVEPGEMVIITKEGIESRKLTEKDSKLDMFELVYFARHDSMLYGQRVNEVRRKFGEQLAEQHPPRTDDSSNILVVPVPDTSVPAAEGYANALGLKHGQPIIKNRYIGRTFMQPTDSARKQQLRRKHNIIPEAVTGKDVILIDDSIVRLNTLPLIVKQAYLAGAKSVTALVASPPVRFPDYYGIDTPSQNELAAAVMKIEEIRERSGCDYLGYLSLSRMVEATGLTQDKFNLSCFTGEYPIDIGPRNKEITKPVSMEYVD